MISDELSRALRYQAGDRVFFPPGSDQLGTRARIVLEAQASWLQSRPDVGALVMGYADEPLSDADNVRLSQGRATAVRQGLVDAGVAPGRVLAHGVGRADKLAPCPASACAAQNRRAVTQVLQRHPLVQGSQAPTESRKASK